MKNNFLFDYFRQIFGWLFALIMFLLLLSLAIPPSGGCRVKANTTKSLNNLKQIGLALRMYANDHQGQFPSGEFPEVVYRQLMPKYLPNNSVFINPGDQRMKNIPQNNKLYVGECGYSYISGNSEKSDDRNPLASDPVESQFTLSHTNRPSEKIFDGDGVNILYVDGSAIWASTHDGILYKLFTDAQIREGKLRPRNPVSPKK